MKARELASQARGYLAAAHQQQDHGNHSNAADLFHSAARYYELAAAEPGNRQADSEYWLGHSHMCRTNALSLSPETKAASLGPVDSLEIKDEYVEQFIVHPEDIPFSLEDLGGLEKAKSVVRRLQRRLDNPERAQRHPLADYRGVMLFGPPGCGKTLFATAIAKSLGCTFFLVSTSDLISKWYGESVRIISRLFQLATQYEPSIVFLDEVDGLLPQRDRLQHEESTRIVNQFLSELDGFRAKISSKRVIFLSATNKLPDEMDPALMRPGRTDRILFIGLPVSKARAEIFRAILRVEPVEDLDYQRLAQLTDGFSGADIRAVCSQASENTSDLEEQQGAELSITMAALQAAIARTVPSVSTEVQARYLNAARQVGAH